MKSRSMNVRTKVVALLVSLVALWGFAAFVTARDGLNLLWVSTLDQKYGRPTDALIVALQEERRLSVARLGNGAQDAALQAQRARTDEAVAKFRTLAQGTDVRLAASAQAEQRVAETFARLGELRGTREAVDAATIDRRRAAAAFTDIINAGFRIYGSLATLDDPAVAKDGRTLVSMTRAREIFSQEDALLVGALTAGRMTPAEHAQFVELVGTQRYLHAEANAELPPADHDRYQRLAASPTLTRARNLEDLVIRSGAGRTPVSADEWTAAVQPAMNALRDLVVAGVADVVDRATPAATGVILRLGLAGGLGLIAVIASVLMSITTARALVAQLEKLRRAASDLATKRLPGVVDRLRRGEKVDVAAEAPPLAFGTDEIGQVGHAINLVQQTAIRTAVQQAELRDSVRDLFLGLARRNQALLHRQLRALDAIERRETDPRELADLFQIDHLATRMRRNAENLIVLSGATPGRRWRNPVPLVDVLRGAVAEVEDYTRVTVMPIEGVWLAGRAVSDVIHLIAELMENATSFSPPNTPVHVTGQPVANGFVVEVEDRGLGMSASELAAANDLITNPPDFNLSSTSRLGLYVVGRLAQRHNIEVHLRRSPYGGTTAIVLIPTSLVVTGTDGIEARDRQAVDLSTPAGDTSITPQPISRNDVTENRNDAQPKEPATLAAWPPPAPALPAAVQNATPQPTLVQTPQHIEPRAADAATSTAQTAAPVPLTPAGLPWRVRQANLADGLRDTPRGAPTTDHSRTPEQIREMMASYQRASLRGRAAADESPETAMEHRPVATDHPTAQPADSAAGEHR